MKRIRVHSVEQYVSEIGPLMQKGLDTYRADIPEEGLLGLGFVGADTEVLISIAEFKATGDLIKYGAEPVRIISGHGCSSRGFRHQL